jgi:hypothetical protein
MANRSECGLAIVALALLSTATAHADLPDETLDAVWRTQIISFVYRGYSTFYTCRSLENKLEAILSTMGARDDLRVDRFGCDEEMGIARFRLTFNSPVEATADNVAALTHYDSQEVLIARVRGETLASAEDLPRFPAVWKTVTFARDRTLRLRSGDCELVEQVRRQILSRMSVRIINDRVRCSEFGNISPPRLTVAALVAAPPAPVALAE